MEGYRRSGKLGRGVLPAALGGGVLIAVGGAFLYQLLVDEIHVQQLRGLATIGFGLLLGAVILISFVWWHGRSRLAGIGVAVVLAVVAEALASTSPPRVGSGICGRRPPAGKTWRP